MENSCITKQECDWIKCTVCEKWLREKRSIFSKTCIDICSKYLEKRTKSAYKQVRRSRILKENIVYRLLFCLLYIYNLVLHYMWGVINHAYAKDTILHTFLIITAVSKRI